MTALHALTPGNRVIQLTHSAGQPTTARTVLVDRVTATQVIIGRHRYRKDTGKQVGGGVGWCTSIAPTGDPEAQAALAAGNGRAPYPGSRSR